MIEANQRFTKGNPCPICGGWDTLRRGQRERCHGYISSDEQYAHCAREEYAGEIKLNPDSLTYAHLLSGRCNCGAWHSSSNSAELAPHKPQPPHSGAKIVATYGYRDAGGELLYQAVRFEPKSFKFRRPASKAGWIWNMDGVSRVLYRYPELLAGDPDEPVYLAEGEKDADNLAEIGVVATTNPAGAGKWRAEYTKVLQGRRIVILPDNDQVGVQHAVSVAKALYGVAANVKIVHLPNLPDKGDASDWLEAGGTVADLAALVAQTPEYSPSDCSQAPPPAVGVWKESIFETAADLCQSAHGEHVTWIAYPWVARGAMTEVDAKVKEGKTTFILALCRAVIYGEDFLGQPTTKAPVVYLTEQAKPSFAEALKKAGLDSCLDFIVMRWANVMKLNWPEVVDAAIAKCKEIGAGMLVIDTFGKFAKLDGDRENSSGDTNKALAPLESAVGKGIGVVLIRHDRKSGGQVGDSGRGSSAISGTADIIMALRRPEGNSEKNARVIHAISRFSATPDELMIELVDGQYVAHGKVEPLATKKASDAILAALPDVPEDALTVKQLVSITGQSPTTINRALQGLPGDKVQVIGTGKKGDPKRYYAEIHSNQTPIPQWAAAGKNVPLRPTRFASWIADALKHPAAALSGIKKGIAGLSRDGTAPDPSGLVPIQPTGVVEPLPRCKMCRGQKFWLRGPSDYVCAVCHPCPHEGAFMIGADTQLT